MELQALFLDHEGYPFSAPEDFLQAVPTLTLPIGPKVVPFWDYLIEF